MLYRDAVSTGCGSASSAVGPFYCPADQNVYLDLGFYDDMAQQLGAQGDFAWAYVIAHEVGHHVQQQLGTSDEVRRLSRENPDRGERAVDALRAAGRLLLRRLGVLGVRAGDLEEGDAEEAMRAAAAVGDDRLQRQAGGRIDPDSFTHGTSEQRARWFENGRGSGDPADCDTFSAESV